MSPLIKKLLLQPNCTGFCPNFACVKFVSLIFSIYIAFIACYPCSDQATCVDEERTGTTIVFSGHEHSSQEIDLCSPFCICNCCSSQFNQPGSFSFEAYCPKFSDQNSVLRPHRVKSIPHTIWQPPRLV
jgi:hypothetical protein